MDKLQHNHSSHDNNHVHDDKRLNLHLDSLDHSNDPSESSNHFADCPESSQSFCRTGSLLSPCSRNTRVQKTIPSLQCIVESVRTDYVKSPDHQIDNHSITSRAKSLHATKQVICLSVQANEENYNAHEELNRSGIDEYAIREVEKTLREGSFQETS